MTQYLYTIPIIFMTILCMLFLTATNEYILKVHKKAFLVAFLGEFFIIVCELLSIFLNGSSPEFKIIHFLSNYFGFILTPILMVFFATAIGRFHRFKGAAIGIAIYFVICNVLIATKQLFYIDAQNVYHRENMFCLYIVSYFIAVIYLFYETFRFSLKGFLQHKIFTYLLSMCFLVSISIQVFIPDIYMTRIAVVFCLCVYYAYIIELTNLFDKLTGVLNQGTYIRKAKELKEQQTVIILDIDDFKYINDNYGHQYGDTCLVIVSQVIKSIFRYYGQCYRIGGDEFAIIIRRNNNLENLISNFEKVLADKFKNSPHQLTVSLGYSKYEKHDTSEKVIERADFNMYNVKKSKKALKAETLNNK